MLRCARHDGPSARLPVSTQATRALYLRSTGYMKQIRRLFVCAAQKSGVGKEVAKALKKELKRQGLQKLEIAGETVRVQVQTCDCLDLCRNCKKGPGAALIAYPEAVTYGNVLPADAAALVAEHFGRGQVLKRLQIEK